MAERIYMLSRRQLFLDHVAQTSELALGLEVDRAEGMYVYTKDGKKYLDLNSGISVSSLGHCHPAVVEAIQAQSNKHLHTMVYGEHIQDPQADYASRLLPLLSKHFESIYYVMTGTEAVELSLKLSRLYSGRIKIIAARHAYHGSLSLIHI